jgi:protein TonB
MAAQAEHRAIARGGSFVAVIGLHVALLYALATGLGVVEVPKIAQPIVAMMINDESKPHTPEIKPPAPKIQVATDLTPPPPDTVDVQAQEQPTPPSDSAPTASTDSTPVLDSSAVKIRNHSDPTYPSASRRAGEQGTVMLKILIGEDGRARDVQVERSSGFARLDDAAVDAVRKWRFAAAVKNGAAMTGWVTLPVTFRLDS